MNYRCEMFKKYEIQVNAIKFKAGNSELFSSQIR